MAIENESKNEDLDLGSMHHNDQDKSNTVKIEDARLALKIWAYGVTTQRIMPESFA